jgi:acyl-CoA synthetase (AMP-forming)/AMP-acid ligase II
MSVKDGPGISIMRMFRKNRAEQPKTEPIIDDAPPGPETAPAASRFVFVDDAGSETSFSPQAALGRIHAVAELLRQRVPHGSAIGLLFRSSPDLVLSWFACLHAGLRPLIVQYPTRKQSRAYWSDSVTNTIATAGLAALIADDYCATLGLPDNVTLIPVETLDVPASASVTGPLLPSDFSILQLSSGTTGYRKAMEFSAEALRRHAADFNETLRLAPGRDRIVSWLPLYHDMGYVACFVMPILLGIDVVMMDPVTWVQNPGLLFDAIERHRGTICYMPNFGFEVMSRAPGRPLPSMRYWISCSEPVSATTAAKFCTHVGADPSVFAPCYAMAENLFAVTFGTGYETRVVDGVDVVSCGTPIQGVSIKTVDGEVWVRSPTSLSCYLGGEDIRDADGYYPTGDMGQIFNGALFVTGRKQDVLIQAGRKFMLSDVDLKLNAAYPEVRGRAATLSLRDDRLGTETALILIEAPDFFDRADAPDIAARMIDETGMDQVEVAYVPPRFLTKTSSGKINRRKTRADWLAAQDAKHRALGPRDRVQTLHDAFPLIDWTRPIRDVLDSLSQTIIRIALEGTPVVLDISESLNDLVARMKAAAPSVPATVAAGEATQEAVVEEGIRIVSTADRSLILKFTEDDLKPIEDAFGCKVTLEHVCLPPAPILLSDLIFHEWFQPRASDQAPYAEIDSAMDRLRNASLILADDVSQLNFLNRSTYPVLSHLMERHADADLLSYRWQNYTKQHHLLPLSFISGREMPPDSVSKALLQLSRYLGTPILRVLTAPPLDEYCKDWECKVPRGIPTMPRRNKFIIPVLIDFLRRQPELRKVKLRPGPPIMINDLAHFCSAMANRKTVDKVVDAFDSFYVGGQPSSLPYLRRKLDEVGKPYVLVPSLTAEFLDQLPQKCACLIACGSWGAPPEDLPVVSFQHIGQGWVVKNLGPAAKSLGNVTDLNDYPASPRDWYFNAELRPITAAERNAMLLSMKTPRISLWNAGPGVTRQGGADAAE